MENSQFKSPLFDASASWNGFSYSSKTDITTPGFANQYSCITGKGAGNSNTYAVFYSAPPAYLVELPSGASFNGFWINNSTYAYLSMK